MRYRIQLYWSGRSDSVDTMAHQIQVLVSSLRGLDEGLSQWLWRNPETDELESLASKKACQSALQASAFPWQMGAEQRRSYQPHFFLNRDIEPPGELLLTCGITPFSVPAFVPNRLTLLLSPRATKEEPTRLLFERILRLAVPTFKPDWGYAGTEYVPTAPLPMFSDGRPAVGWMTYLSSRFPPLPATFDEPASVHAVARHGHIIVAYPRRYDPGHPEHAEAVAQVRRALDEAQVLIPNHMLQRQSTTPPEAKE